MKSSAVKKPASRRAARAPGSPASAWGIRKARGVRIVEARALSRLKWLVHGFSTRPGGESVLGSERVLNLGFTEWDERRRVEANRDRFAGALGARRWPLATLRQIHSDVIYLVTATGETAPQGDGLITRTPKLLLAVQAADCVPILLADTRNRAVAAVHAGWRGTLARIAAKAIGRMRMEFGTRPADIVAALGPAIGRCCYQVGPEVAQGFAMQFPCAAEWFDGPFAQLAHGEEPLWLPWLTMMPPGHVPPPPRVQLDLRAANRWQLIDAGVPERAVTVSEMCTACRTELLFSYRREGAKTGRMVGMIAIR